jgi:hypothetical protein
MKKIILLSFILKSIFVLAQGTDTIYFTGNIPNIYNSNTQKIIHHLFSKCNTTQKETYNEKIESNREFRTVSNLNLFNKESKTNIFTSADVVIISYFCQNIDYVNEIELYEFLFNSEISAIKMIEKLSYLHKKQGFNDYIGFKNWYFKRVKNIVYFIDSKEEKSEIKELLKEKIELINEITHRSPKCP